MYEEDVEKRIPEKGERNTKDMKEGREEGRRKEGRKKEKERERRK